MVSWEQSRHETFRNFAVIFYTSIIHKFELLCTLARGVMSLASLSAAEKDVDTFCWLFTAVRLWTWETTVSCHDSSETTLTPLQFTCALLFDTLDCVHGVLASTRAVTLYLTWHLYHSLTLSIRPTSVLYLVVTE